MTTRDLIGQQVSYIEEDMSAPNSILYSTPNTLTVDNITYGIEGTSGCQNGSREDVRFSNVNGFTQLNKSAIIIADGRCACLRILDRKATNTSAFSGQCGEFRRPHSVIRDKSQTERLYVSDWGNDSIKLVNISQPNSISILAQSTTLLHNPSGMTQHPTTFDLYISTNTKEGLALYELSTLSLRKLKIAELQLNTPRGLIFIADNELLVADYGANVLQHIDLSTKTVIQTICSREEGSIDGNFTQCQMEKPTALALLADNVLLIATANGIREIRGELLSLKFIA